MPGELTPGDLPRRDLPPAPTEATRQATPAARQPRPGICPGVARHALRL